jgi:hypothetical protein
MWAIASVGRVRRKWVMITFNYPLVTLHTSGPIFEKNKRPIELIVLIPEALGQLNRSGINGSTTQSLLPYANLLYSGNERIVQQQNSGAASIRVTTIFAVLIYCPSVHLVASATTSFLRILF